MNILKTLQISIRGIISAFFQIFRFEVRP